MKTPPDVIDPGSWMPRPSPELNSTRVPSRLVSPTTTAVVRATSPTRNPVPAVDRLTGLLPFTPAIPALPLVAFARDSKTNALEDIDRKRVHSFFGAGAIAQPAARRARICAGKLGEIFVLQPRAREPDEVAERNFSFPGPDFFTDIFVRSRI